MKLPAGHPRLHGAREELPLAEWGIVSLRTNVLHEALTVDDPVARVVHVLSLGGRVPPALGLAATPRAERMAWDIAASAASSRSRARVSRAAHITLDTHHRMRFRDEPINAEVSVAQVALTRATATAIEDARECALLTDREDERALEAWEATLSDDTLGLVLAEASDALLHAAPLVLFSREARFSSFVDENLPGKALMPSASNSVLRPRGLAAFKTEPVEVRMLVMCIHMLLRAGGPHRLEERNWTQITPSDVQAHLEAARRRYAAITGSAVAAPVRADLATLADAARTERAAIERGHQRYRHIWAPLLHKRERFAPPEAVAQAQITFESALATTSLAADHGPRYVAGRGEEYAEAFSANMLTGPEAYEEAITLTVAAVIEATHSEVAMSRGHRQPRELARALAAPDWGALAAREQDEFYCCVLPSVETMADSSRPDLVLALWAMAARMQFNSWHFFGGNLEPVAPVRARDTFIPPRIPDISQWSDLHHRGHVATHVRFAVRAPAAATLAGRRFWGFNDIRLLRFSGRPFAADDMLIALAAAQHLAQLTTMLADGDAAVGDIGVRAFDRAWYVSGEVFNTAHNVLR